VATQTAQTRWGFADTMYLVVAAASLTLLIALFGSVYYFVEWHAMTQDCRPHGHSQSVGYAHSWTRGFTCTSSDGHQQWKFWW
jgi:hypothetical protein